MKYQVKSDCRSCEVFRGDCLNLVAGLICLETEAYNAGFDVEDGLVQCDGRDENNRCTVNVLAPTIGERTEIPEVLEIGHNLGTGAIDLQWRAEFAISSIKQLLTETA